MAWVLFKLLRKTDTDFANFVRILYKGEFMTDTTQQATRPVNSLHSTIPFRIRIGVTGHRQLTDEEKLSEKIRQVLQKDIFTLFENSDKVLRSIPNTPILFSILTPLAEGADRLVAKEVLKLPDSRMEVVLPLVKQDYLEDFQAPESRHEFEELMKKARRPITLRERTLKEEFSGNDLVDARRKAYEDVGRYVVDNCDVLIALWDGQESRGKGGTKEIIDYAKKKERPVITISTLKPYVISPTKGHGINTQSLIQFEMFNSFPVQKDYQRYLENIYKETFGNPEGERLPDKVKNLVKEKLLPYYVRASKIAKQNQDLYLFTGTIAYSLSAVAIALVALGILSRILSPYAFFLEFLLLGFVLFLVIFADRQKTHRKWIESRFIAERIRSARFFVVCGVEMPPIDVPPYMGVAHQMDDWMVRAFREIWDGLPAMRGCSLEDIPLYRNFVREQWVKNQMKYHGKKHIERNKKSRRFERCGYGIFFVAMIVAITDAIFHVYGNTSHDSEVNHVLVFLAIVLPSVGAALGGIRTHREYSRLEKRHKNMEAVLSNLDERISKIGTPGELEKFIKETDELMLRETQDWLMLMRFVELKPEA